MLGFTADSWQEFAAGIKGLAATLKNKQDIIQFPDNPDLFLNGSGEFTAVSANDDRVDEIYTALFETCIDNPWEVDITSEESVKINSGLYADGKVWC